MKKLAAMIAFIGLLLLTACSGSEAPTESPEMGIVSQIQEHPTAQIAEQPQLPSISAEVPIEGSQELPALSTVDYQNDSSNVHELIYYDAPPSLDMQIFEADIIVVATLVSAIAGIQADGDLFLPVQELRFRSSEYLKGSGPAEFIVVGAD